MSTVTQTGAVAMNPYAPIDVVHEFLSTFIDMAYADPDPSDLHGQRRWQLSKLADQNDRLLGFRYPFMEQAHAVGWPLPDVDCRYRKVESALLSTFYIAEQLPIPPLEDEPVDYRSSLNELISEMTGRAQALYQEPVDELLVVAGYIAYKRGLRCEDGTVDRLYVTLKGHRLLMRGDREAELLGFIIRESPSTNKIMLNLNYGEGKSVSSAVTKMNSQLSKQSKLPSIPFDVKVKYEGDSYKAITTPKIPSGSTA